MKLLSGGDKPYLISGADDKTVKLWDYQVSGEYPSSGEHFLGGTLPRTLLLRRQLRLCPLVAAGIRHSFEPRDLTPQPRNP